MFYVSQWKICFLFYILRWKICFMFYVSCWKVCFIFYIMLQDRFHVLCLALKELFYVSRWQICFMFYSHIESSVSCFMSYIERCTVGILWVELMVIHTPANKPQSYILYWSRLGKILQFLFLPKNVHKLNVDSGTCK